MTDLVGLHLPRTSEELRATACALLDQLIPDRPLALLLDDDDPGSCQVELIRAPCPLDEGTTVPRGAWRPDGVLELPIPYRDTQIGCLVVAGPDDFDRASLTDVLHHLGVALVNLHLGQEARLATDQYCASLQAFEEGVVLFQESERDAIGARFMSLLGSVLGTPIGALLVLEKIGDTRSKLQVDQCVGIPESMLEQLLTTDGEWWPTRLLDRAAQVWQREAEADDLDPSHLPPVLHNIVCCPLRYHGVIAGVCLSFNAPIESRSLDTKLDSVRRLGELGAALYHRLSLEKTAIRSRTLQTQLEIAATIQARLLPRAAPDCPSLECAWRSKPAESIGGDYLDLLTDELGDVFAVIADVSGHGIDSALLMTSFRSTYRADCLDLQPDALMETLNEEVVHEVGHTGMFITAASFHLSRDGRKLTYASAGHNPVLLYRSSNGALQDLDSTGPSLGFFPGSDYGKGEAALHAGDVLLLYTDGVVEETNDSGEMFELDRLRKCLALNATRSAGDILNAIYNELKAFTGREGTEDDVSVSVLKIL